MMKEQRLLRLKDIKLILGVGRTTLWKIINEDPDFPPKIHITSKTYAFDRSKFEAWLDKKSSKVTPSKTGNRSSRAANGKLVVMTESGNHV